MHILLARRLISHYRQCIRALKSTRGKANKRVQNLNQNKAQMGSASRCRSSRSVYEAAQP